MWPPPVHTVCEQGQHIYTFGGEPRPGTMYRCVNCGSAPQDGSAFARPTGETGAT
jgi:hypothetical protein